MENKSRIRAGIIAGAVLLTALLLWALWPAAAIKGGEPPQRVESVMHLASEKPLGAVTAFTRAIASPEEHPNVRQAALVALSQFPRNSARPAVEAVLADPLPEIRAAAATALGAYDNDAVCDRLGDIILDNPDPDPAVRIGAIRGLGLNPCPKALAWLIRVIERETTPAVHRHALMEAYAKIGAHYYLDESASVTEAQRRGPAEFLKRDFKVQEAYRYASWPLDMHPEFYQPTQCEASKRARNRN